MKNFFTKVADRVEKLDASALKKQFNTLTGEISFLESVLDTISEGIMVVSPDGAILQANSAAEKLLGFKFAASQNKPVHRTIPGFDWDSLIRPSSTKNWNRLAAREVEIAYPEHRILELNSHLGKSGNVIIVARDVTADREQTRRDIESGKSDAVRDLAAGVAHEIGNPLNAISLGLQLLAREFRSEPDPDRKSRILDDIATAQNEVKRLEDIIRGFLSALRPVAPSLVPGSVADPLKNTLATLKPQFANRQIRVLLDLPNAIPPVMLDVPQLEQVFFNLVKNALEAMKDGGELDIEITHDDRDVRISFRDNGAGMNAATLARVFEPYQTSKSDGNGLGLMISRRIARAHGGDIEAESREGEGAKFTVRIPRLEKRIRSLN